MPCTVLSSVHMGIKSEIDQAAVTQGSKARRRLHFSLTLTAEAGGLGAWGEFLHLILLGSRVLLHPVWLDFPLCGVDSPKPCPHLRLWDEQLCLQTWPRSGRRHLCAPSGIQNLVTWISFALRREGECLPMENSQAIVCKNMRSIFHATVLWNNHLVCASGRWS